MPNLATFEIALTRLSPCWERGSESSCHLKYREVPYPLSPDGWCVRQGRAWGLGTGPSRCLLHKDAAVWAGCGWRWLLQPPGSGRDAALSLQACWKHPLLPDPIPGQASKLQDPKQKGCGQVGEVGCWSVF